MPYYPAQGPGGGPRMYMEHNPYQVIHPQSRFQNAVYQTNRQGFGQSTQTPAGAPPTQHRRSVSSQRKGQYSAQRYRGRQAHTVRDLYGRVVTYNRAPTSSTFYAGGPTGAGAYPAPFLAQEVDVTPQESLRGPDFDAYNY